MTDNASALVATPTVVLHGKTRWSETLSDYVFRDGIEFTVTFEGKQPITHREGSRCLSRTTGDLPTAEPIAKTKATFTRQVRLEEEGKDRTAWFCTRCLIQLPKNKLASEQIEALRLKGQTPKEEAADKAAVTQKVTASKPVTKPAGSRINRPGRPAKATSRRS
jgi:hypothetical protein